MAAFSYFSGMRTAGRKSEATYIESQETDPNELKPGDRVGVSWGFPLLESVEITDTHYTMTFVPDAHGKRPVVRCAIANWPFVATGNKARKGQNVILRDGARY